MGPASALQQHTVPGESQTKLTARSLRSLSRQSYRGGRTKDVVLEKEVFPYSVANCDIRGWHRHRKL